MKFTTKQKFPIFESTKTNLVFGTQKNKVFLRSRKQKFSRKAQTEIIGLAIIVIIIVIGLFFVMFSNPTESFDDKQNLLDAQLAQTMLSVMMDATTDCEADLSEVIEDCYGKNDLCGNSCNYAADKIKEILDGTFVKWNKPYHLYVSKDNEIKIDVANSDLKCTKSTEKSASGLSILALEYEVIVVTLDICK